MPFTKDNADYYRKEGLKARHNRITRALVRQNAREKKHEPDGKFLADPAVVKRGFNNIQRRALEALKKKASAENMEGMGLEELSKLLRICRENLHAIHQLELTERESAESKIEFVMKKSLDRKGGKGTVN